MKSISVFVLAWILWVNADSIVPGGYRGGDTWLYFDGFDRKEECYLEQKAQEAVQVPRGWTREFLCRPAGYNPNKERLPTRDGR
jgi:hypothetical protein